MANYNSKLDFRSYVEIVCFNVLGETRKQLDFGGMFVQKYLPIHHLNGPIWDPTWQQAHIMS